VAADGTIRTGARRDWVAAAFEPPTPGAARGFNGDIGQHLRRWRQELESRAVVADLLGMRTA